MARQAKPGTALLRFEGRGGGVDVEFPIVVNADRTVLIDLTGQVFGRVHGSLTLEIKLPEEE